MAPGAISGFLHAFVENELQTETVVSEMSKIQ